MSNINLKQVGKLIQARRQYLRLNQQEVANAIGTSRSNFCRYEMGAVDLNMSTLKALSAALTVPISYFFPEGFDFGSDEPTIESYYRGLPPDKQEMVREMVKAAHQQAKRAETTHGRKAE